MFDGTFVAFFREYSVLARLLTTLTENALIANVEFALRYVTDLDDIRRDLSPTAGLISALGVGLSDSHFNGRSVMALCFPDGPRVIYKPKNIQSELAFANLQSWLKTEGDETPLNPVRVIDCTTHGWSEVLARATHDQEHSVAYFFNTGRLLCLAYLLGGTDFHYENVLATSAHPILIDLEMIFTASREPTSKQRWRSARQPLLSVRESVLSTGLLPMWQETISGKPFDISGLCPSAFESEFPFPCVSHVNTDNMRVTFRRSQAHTQREGDGNQDIETVPDELRQAVAKGFNDTYETILRSQGELRRRDGPLLRFAGSRIRYVCRATRLYNRLLHRLRLPQFMRTGVDFGKGLAMLLDVVRHAEDDSERKQFEAVVFSELQFLERLDIPHFNHSLDGLDLYADDKIVTRRFFRQSGLERVRRRLQAMGDADRIAQVRIIEGSFRARFGETILDAPTEPLPPLDDDVKIANDQLVGIAVEIGEQFLKKAITRADGSVAWVSLTADQATGRVNVIGTDLSIYEGNLGTAVFLSALYAETKDARFLHLALGAMKPLGQLLRDNPVELWYNSGFGLEGLGGVLAGLTSITGFLPSEAPREYARRIAEAVAKADLERDKRHDVLNGAAGAILGLFSYLQSSGNNAIADTIVVIGSHILGSRIYCEEGFQVWKTIADEPALNGFAHGSAGIGLSLLLAHQLGAGQMVLDAYQEAVAFEKYTYSRASGTWLDRRRNIGLSAGHNSSWCHGATGIGFARLLAYSRLKEASLLEDVEYALAFVLGMGSSRIDSLCCGELGCIDFLITAGSILARPALLDAAKARMCELLRRWRRAGGFCLSTGITSAGSNPGLFQGAAGVGYLALRLLAPYRYPSVLIAGIHS
jgi:type 2 lantibiotic biosynthesis protein LanM